MSEKPTRPLSDLSVLVASIVTTGYVDEMYAASHEEMRACNIENGFTKVEYLKLPSPLVELGRDHAVKHALKENYDAILFIDADMCGFPRDSMIRMLRTMFADLPFADALGGYCTLKQPPHLPTIDTGTGTWELHYPNSGILEVIRTGGAFVMVKTTLLRRMVPFYGELWFRVRSANKPLAALADVDNFARCKLGNRNPFLGDDWTALLQSARGEHGPGESGIGEDSGFCDRAKAVGARLFVDTRIVTGHVTKDVLTWERLKSNIKDRERRQRLAVGVTA